MKGIKNLTSRKKAVIACGGMLVLLAGVLSAGIMPAKQATAQVPPSNMTQQGNVTSLGKLKALDIASEILKTKIKIKLLEAVQKAAGQLGPDAQVLSAKLTLSGDDVVYKVVGLKEGRLYVITVDPVDGNMLESKNFTLREIHKMHLRGELADSGMDGMMFHSMMGQ